MPGALGRVIKDNIIIIYSYIIMPYKRSRRRYRKGNGMSSQVYKNKRDLKRLKKGIEYKKFDSIVTAAEANTTATPSYLCTIDQGINDLQRIGRKITANRIFIRGFVHNDHGTPEDCIVRIALVRWKSGEGGTLTHAQVWNSQQGTGSIVNRSREPNSAGLFQVYLDHTFVMDTTQHSLIPFKINQKLRQPIEYNAITGLEATCERNGLYLFVFSNIAGTTNNPQVTFIARLSYSDL